jgi:hypothetical protein
MRTLEGGGELYRGEGGVCSVVIKARPTAIAMYEGVGGGVEEDLKELRQTAQCVIQQETIFVGKREGRSTPGII